MSELREGGRMTGTGRAWLQVTDARAGASLM